MENQKLGQTPAFPTKPKQVIISRNSYNFTDENGIEQIGYNNTFGELIEDGISKRFYTATKILCALISNADRHSQEGDCHSWNYNHLSKIAFEATDEFLKVENEIE